VVAKPVGKKLAWYVDLKLPRVERLEACLGKPILVAVLVERFLQMWLR
jgi:hypothetical protein